jgi:hypothetical protein
MNKGERKRAQLFEMYSTNLEFLKPYIETINQFNEPLYACPICLNTYEIGALNQHSQNPLTIEHVPAQNVGGKQLVLTCKDCNNHKGAKLDKALQQFNKVQAFHNSEGSMPVRLSQEGKNLGSGEIRFLKDGGFVIKGQPQNKKLDFNEVLKTGKSLNFKYNSPTLRITLVAKLRIAYLMAFSRMGYHFIVNENLKPIRDQISNSSREIIPEIPNLSNVTEHNEGLFMMGGPNDLKFILVVFKTNYGGKIELNGIVLPPPFENAIEFYSKFQQYIGEKYVMTFSEIPKESDFITDQNLALELHKMLRNPDRYPKIESALNR